MLETRKIGSLNVTTVGLGTNSFGSRLSADESVRVVHSAIDSGVNFIDTADVYGSLASETFIGQALRDRRDEVVLATKFGMRADDDHLGGAAASYVQSSVEGSLRRLATDRIDLYIVHRPDPKTPIGETLYALDGLVESGKVREIGCSCFSVEQLQEARTAVADGAARFVNLQSEYSILYREPELGVLEECEKQGLGFVPFRPLAKGFLTGKYGDRSAPPVGTVLTKASEKQQAAVLNDRNYQIAGSLSEYVAARGRTMLELAIGWLLAHREVSSVITGASSTTQIAANAASASWVLTATELSEVNELLPDITM